MRPEVLFVVEVPTPQMTPSVDEIHRQGIPVASVFFRRADTQHGWGDVVPEHPYEVAPAGRFRSTLHLAGRVLDPRLKVLVCFGYHRPASCAAILLARLRGVRVVTRSDSNWLQERLRPRLRILVKRVALRAIFGRRTRVWTVGTQNDAYWAAFGMRQRHLIPFGVPQVPVGSPPQRAAFRRRYGLDAGPTFLYVGMLEPWKGVDLLLDAFRTVPAESARLVVVGQGSLAGEVRAAAAADTRIRYCGPMARPALASAYAAADVLVLPSRRDAWGLVVDEAQANGLRVIVSDAVGAAPDRVRADNGWVFPSGSVEDLAATLSAAVREHGRGWAPLPRTAPPDPAPAMVEDLIRLGARYAVHRVSAN